MSDFVSNIGQIAHEIGSVNPVMHTRVVTLEEIGARLRAEREARGLSQSDFGQIGSVTRNSQAAYESGQRACDADYLRRLKAAGVDICYVMTGERSTAAMPDDVADYAALSPRLGSEEKSALLVLASAAAGRAPPRAAVTPPIALPPEEALERGFLGVMAASRSMDEAALARELAKRLPTMLGVLKGRLTIERDDADAAEAPATAHPGQRRA